MKSRFGIIMLAIALIVAAACNKEGDNGDLGITFDKACDMTSPYDYAGQTRTFTFNATTAWSVVAEDEEWIIVEPNAGSAGFGQFNVIVASNPTGEERRSYLLVRLANGKATKIDVVQEMMPVFDREARSVYTLDSEGGEITIAVATNQQYSVSIAATDSWLRSSVEDTRVVSDQTITLSAEANVESLSRVAVVNIVAEDKSILDTFSVVQGTAGIADNEIVYYTNNSAIIELSTTEAEEYGAALRTHFYDKHLGCGRVVFGGEVRHIPTRSFADQRRVTGFVLPSKLESIGEGAFAGCTACRSFTIPASVVTLGGALFEGCSGELITECDIPNVAIVEGKAITASDKGHWLYGSTFDSVVLRGKVGKGAFNGYGLRSVTFDKGVGTVSSNAFAGCTALESVYAASMADWCDINFGNGEANPLSGGTAALVVDNREVARVAITEGIKAIGPYAFYNYQMLENITLTGDVASIGTGAFAKCDVDTITLGESIASIGSGAFRESRCATLVVEFTVNDMPGDTTNTRNWFYGLSATKLVIGNRATAVGDLAFSNSSALRSVVIGEGVEVIDNGAFAGCSNLESVALGEGVERIAEHAFYNCPKLSDINIPDSVTSIGDYTFQQCRSLQSIAIGEGVTYIGNYAFRECDALEAIHLSSTTPAKLGGDYVFDQNNNALRIYVPASVVDNYRSTPGWQRVASKIVAQE